MNWTPVKHQWNLVKLDGTHQRSFMVNGLSRRLLQHILSVSLMPKFRIITDCKKRHSNRPVWLNTAKEHYTGPQRIGNTAKDHKVPTKEHYTWPQSIGNTAKDHKGALHMTTEHRQYCKGPTKGCKGTLRAKLQEIGTNWTEWCLIFQCTPRFFTCCRT